MRFPIIASSILLLAPALAVAQESNPSKGWTSSIGVATVAMPGYVGSNRYRVRVVPVVQLEVKDRVYFGSSSSGIGGGLGVYVVRKSSFMWSTELASSGKRRENLGDGLAGMGTRTGGNFIGNNISYRVDALTISAGAAVGLGKNEGSNASVNIDTKKRFGSRWIGGVSTGATFANADNMAFDFGITSAQAGKRQALIAAGDSRLSVGEGAAYAPNGGLKQVQASTSLGFLITRRATAMAFASGTRLGREAADSPLTRKRNGLTGGLGIVYGI